MLENKAKNNTIVINKKHSHDDTLNHMTSPTDYKRNMIEVLDYLDTILPNGSYVAMSGLADGMVLWDTMHDRLAIFAHLKKK